MGHLPQLGNLTDHDDTMADEEFTTLMSMRGNDERVMRGSEQIASRILCDDGHRVLVTVGGENDLMPIMLDRHVPGTVQERHDTYNGNDAAAVWRDATDGPDLERRPLALPGIGEMKAKSIIAVLGNRFGVRPPGYEQVAPTWPTLGDVDSAEALATYQAGKRAKKAAMRAAGK